MPLATIPLLYNQVRINRVWWEFDPLGTATTGKLTVEFVAWTTTGPIYRTQVDAVLSPDDDPTTALTAAKTNFTNFLEDAGYAAAEDPPHYNA